jgi:hypothetical protein
MVNLLLLLLDKYVKSVTVILQAIRVVVFFLWDFILDKKGSNVYLTTIFELLKKKTKKTNRIATTTVTTTTNRE